MPSCANCCDTAWLMCHTLFASPGHWCFTGTFESPWLLLATLPAMSASLTRAADSSLVLSLTSPGSRSPSLLSLALGHSTYCCCCQVPCRLEGLLIDSPLSPILSHFVVLLLTTNLHFRAETRPWALLSLYELSVRQGEGGTASIAICGRSICACEYRYLLSTQV